MEELWKKVIEIRGKISKPKIGRMTIENGWKSRNLIWEYLYPSENIGTIYNNIG
jgi:hypothetical protein